MKKKTVTRKLNLNKTKVVSLDEMKEVKGGRTKNCLGSADITCQSMCNFSCYVGTCLG